MVRRGPYEDDALLVLDGEKVRRSDSPEVTETGEKKNQCRFSYLFFYFS